MDHGVRIFRVDNPHTKPINFWQWLLGEVRTTDPDVLFLAEAFTRPAMMRELAKVGFHQCYTYFTWRNHQRADRDYLRELVAKTAPTCGRTSSPTPRTSSTSTWCTAAPAAFEIRAVLAAMLSPT